MEGRCALDPASDSFKNTSRLLRMAGFEVAADVLAQLLEITLELLSGVRGSLTLRLV